MSGIVCCGNPDALTQVISHGLFITADANTPIPAIAAQLMGQPADEQRVLVLDASTTTHAAALGFSQRAARNPFRGYILVNPTQLPAAGVYDWPDAPVAVVSTAGTMNAAAELRGWRNIACADDDLSAVIAELVSGFLHS